MTEKKEPVYTGKDIRIDYESEGQKGSLVFPDLYEYHMIANSIFVQGEYPPTRLHHSEVKTIVDIGAHIGAFSLWARLLYPQANIYSFEPCLRLFHYLIKNSEWSRSKIFPFGVSDKTEIKTLFAGELGGCENSVYKNERSVGSGEEVLLLSASEIISQIGIKNVSILKIDTEGSEVPILNVWLKKQKPLHIYVEYHSEEDRMEIDRLLSSDYTLCSSSSLEPHRGINSYIVNTVAASIPYFNNKRISR